MKKIVQHTTGEPDVLVVENAPEPTPAEGEVLIRVRAAGVNPVDAAVRGGFYPLLGEPPYTIGWDVAGEVTKLGKGVSNLKVGDQVFGMPNFPKQAAAYAEIVAVPAEEIVLRPAALGIEEAGALPLAGLTAWQGLVEKANLKAGQRVFIQGAAGGVGHLAVQIAKAKGAYVVASASGEKLDFLRSLGADEVIDYKVTDFATLGETFDIVFDPLDEANAVKSLKVLKKGGVLVRLLGSGDAKAQAEREGKVLHQIMVAPDGEALAALAELVEQGKLKVHIGGSFKLEDAPAAHAFLATKPVGKVVLTV